MWFVVDEKSKRKGKEGCAFLKRSMDGVNDGHMQNRGLFLAIIHHVDKKDLWNILKSYGVGRQSLGVIIGKQLHFCE